MKVLASPNLKACTPWLLFALFLAADVMLYNVYPFYGGRPWSLMMLITSLFGFKLYVCVEALHFALMDLALIAVPLAFLWGVGRRLRFGKLWVEATALLIVLDVLTIVLLDFVTVFWRGPASGFAAEAVVVVTAAVAILDTAYRLVVYPALYPIIILDACLDKGVRLRDYIPKLSNAAILATLLLIAFRIELANLVGSAINAALMRVSPLAIFAYFRGYSAAAVKYMMRDFKYGISFSPALLTWGGLVSEALILLIACLVARYVGRDVARVAEAAGFTA